MQSLMPKMNVLQAIVKVTDYGIVCINAPLLGIKNQKISTDSTNTGRLIHPPPS